MRLEDQVAELLAAGDPDAAATVALEALGPPVLGYLGGLLEADDARDAFSLFAEDLWRGLPGFRGECSLRSWAFRIAWHTAARVLRDPWRRRGERLPTTAASRLAATVATASQLPGGRRDALQALRASLDPEEQTLLALRVDRELEWDEVASVLSTDAAPVTSAALRKRYERLKDRLAAEARARGLLA
jgi:RNA polymerase sigma-70 factor (ECF subfamily)